MLASPARRLALASLTLFLASPARAGDRAPEGPGLELGLRLGIEVPTGTTVRSSQTDLSFIVAKAVPVWAEVGWRFNKYLSVSSTYQAGIGLVDYCDVGCSCQVRDDRLTFHGTVRFDTDGVAFPWLSAGAGFEWFRVKESGLYQADLTVKGTISADLQAGLDFIPAPGWVVGPYLSFAIGRFSSLQGTIMNRTGVVTYPESNRSLHHWSQGGFRTLYSF
jgi:hypothetical protein